MISLLMRQVFFLIKFGGRRHEALALKYNILLNHILYTIFRHTSFSVIDHLYIILFYHRSYIIKAKRKDLLSYSSPHQQIINFQM